MKKKIRQVLCITVVWDVDVNAEVAEALTAARDIVVAMGGEWKEKVGENPSGAGKIQALLDGVLGRMYEPHGDTEDMTVKTSAEVAFEIEDMCAAPVSEVAAWLNGHGFETVVMDGTVSWLLFEKNVSY